MVKYKIIHVLFLLLLCNISAASSRIKYDDVYKVVLSGDKERAYTLLLAYQKQNPEFANAYFQLGIIAKEWAFDFDPYKEFYYTKLFIYNTKLYFNLAKLYMKDEKNKNRSYYKNAPIIPKGKKLKISDIEEYIDAQAAEIKDYEKHVTEIINFYNKSSSFYNECVSLFMKINSDYAKIKNIYLSDDPQLVEDMQKLESNFDSTLVYFKLYKEALSEYPLKNYNQNYHLKDIVTYRLDGLTYSGFLNNDIPLWNYKKWVENVRQVKNNMIKSNRSDIVNQDALIKQKINELENGEYSDEYPEFKLDEKFVYKIEKFDNNSLLIKLFKLNEAKINFLVLFKKPINNPATLTNFPILKRSTYCNGLINKKNKADSINKIFAAGITPEQVKKYKNFYLSVYGGMKGLREYSFRQELFFDAKVKDAFMNLKKHLFLTTYKSTDNDLKYNDSISIHTDITSPNNENIEKNTFYITDFKTTKDNKLWFSGFYVAENDTTQGFTGLSTDKKNIDFLSLSEKSDSSLTYNLLTAPFDKGCFTVKTEIGKQITNTLIKYDNKGNIILKKELPYRKIPRLLKYDDINNIVLIVFNGKTFNKINTDREQIIYHYNPDDQLQTYEVKTEASASVFDMIKRNKKLYIFSNFINYTNLSGNTIFSKAGKNNNTTNVLITVISKGTVEKYIPLFNNHSYFGVKALKLNSNTFNILGYKTNYTENNFSNLKLKELYYELISPKGEVILSAWHD